MERRATTACDDGVLVAEQREAGAVGPEGDQTWAASNPDRRYLTSQILSRRPQRQSPLSSAEPIGFCTPTGEP